MKTKVQNLPLLNLFFMNKIKCKQQTLEQITQRFPNSQNKTLIFSEKELILTNKINILEQNTSIYISDFLFLKHWISDFGSKLSHFLVSQPKTICFLRRIFF